MKQRREEKWKKKWFLIRYFSSFFFIYSSNSMEQIENNFSPQQFQSFNTINSTKWHQPRKWSRSYAWNIRWLGSYAHWSICDSNFRRQNHSKFTKSKKYLIYFNVNNTQTQITQKSTVLIIGPRIWMAFLPVVSFELKLYCRWGLRKQICAYGIWSALINQVRWSEY